VKLTKAIQLDFKAGEKDGTFAGWASVYDEVDHHGDKVMRGAYTKTIAANRGTIKILNQHDPSDVIGTGVLTDKSYGLWLEGQLVLDLPSARDAYTRLKNGLIDAMSIGYVVKRDKFASGARELHEIDLFEVSLVTFPACDPARIESVKSQSTDEREVRDALAALAAFNRKLRETPVTKWTPPAPQQDAAEIERLRASFRNPGRFACGGDGR
jgi:uncharacterized protein